MVFKNASGTDGGPDLVAYIANQSNTYVVAIAGTNIHSDRDIGTYDGLIDSMVDFDGWTSSTGGITSNPNVVTQASDSGTFISAGTALGVYDLVRTTTTVGPSSNTTIVQFLKGLATGSKLIYTGHSLGGALSP